MGANHIIVEKSWPIRKETFIISVKLQPNVIHNQLCVIKIIKQEGFKKVLRVIKWAKLAQQ